MFSQIFPMIFLVVLIAMLISVEVRNRKLRKNCIFHLKTKPKFWYMDLIALLVLPLVPMGVSTMSKLRLATRLQGTNPIQTEFVRKIITNETNYWIYMTVVLAILFIYSFLSQLHTIGIFTEEGFVYKRYFKYDKVDYFILDHKYGYVEIYYKVIFKWQGQVLIKVKDEEVKILGAILNQHGVPEKSGHESHNLV